MLGWQQTDIVGTAHCYVSYVRLRPSIIDKDSHQFYRRDNRLEHIMAQAALSFRINRTNNFFH
jgi:hypothetical protein